jgi:aquaporin Z
MKRYITEGIGTFFFVFVVILTQGQPLAPLAIGATYLAMMYTAGSGNIAHCNPAVSLGALVRGQLNAQDFPVYVLCQLAGAAFAALLGNYFQGAIGATVAVRSIESLSALLAEFVGTFALVYVVLTTTANRIHNSHTGLAAGMVLTGLTWALGPVSGGAFNPAVVIGGAIAQVFAWSDFIIFIIGTLMGAAAAATVAGWVVND